MARNKRMGGAIAACIVSAALMHVAVADEVADFFKGKAVTVVVGHQAGTGFDVYSRVLIRHMGRHIPGSPDMLVQNMTGASGVVAANWLYNIAPKDGTVMGIFANTVPLEQLFGNKRAKFETAKMVWVGNMEQSVAICGVSKAAGVKTFADLQKKETAFGATGATGPLMKSALAVKNLLGAKIRIISGYKGSASVKNAMQRGEVMGVCGLHWSTIKSRWRHELQSGEFFPILQLSGEHSAELRGLAHVNDFIKNDEQRMLFNIIFGVQVLGRAYVLPPDVPKARIGALRKAFMATMADPRFLADAKKTNIDIEPLTGEVVDRMWAEYARTPKSIIAKVKQVVTPPKK